MPDNLSVTISADASQLYVEAQRAKAALSDVTKEAARLRAEAQKTGDWTAFKAFAPQAVAAQRAARSTQKAFNDLGKTATDTSLSITELGKTLGGIARASGLAIGGIRALRFGIAGLITAEVIRGFTSAVDKINELSIAAKEAGTTVGTIKGLQDAFRAAGDDAGKAAPLMASFSKAARESRLTQAEIGKKGSEAFSEAIKAGASSEEAYAAATKAVEAATKSSSDAFKSLGIDVSRYAQTLEGQKQLQADTAAAMLKMKDAGKIDEASIASVKIWGQELAVITPELQKIATGTLNITEPTKAAVAMQEEYNKQVAAGVGWWEKMLEAIGRYTQALIIAQTNQTKFSEITGAPPIAMSGFASGGYIRGPGTSTSDSIIARLSRGEFVMRARAVDHWGPRFLHALNNLQNPFGHYATGGLVRTTPRFASGGMVTARTGDGMTVNLHFPGGQFQLRGDKAIVAGLTREARRAGMLSAGRMPGALA
jgi:hypothetical protein